ncbi:MSCRAMM family protein [Globicatella sp. HMSC072A10]|uniref:MSCRAMM family protein n=1 Tax=Globicatella sp. HMSC072A10 TaxID=1739315 RepID=UPI0008AB0EB6|nr:SpaA isopeptide-forming pilin-related protein [Globicatella sp. HMSC072A10]OFK55179.1 hypothetical protein HMPREF2811_07820 [Globicatella sp. HMSC072A10]
MNHRDIGTILLTVVVIIMSWISFPQVEAAESYQLIIHDSDNPIADIHYTLWQVDDLSYLDQQELMNNFSLAELDALFPSHYDTDKTNSQGYTEISLPAGIYYVRALSKNQFNENIQPFFAELPSNHQRINPKSTQMNGSLKIIKQNQAGQPLADVGFELYYQNGLTPLLFNSGKFTTDGKGSSLLQTDEKGEIYLEYLPAGQYELKEIKPLTGYRPLAATIKVTVNSLETTELVVYNEAVELGGYHFRKVDAKDPTVGLVGAVFEVQQWVDYQYQTYRIDSKPYTVQSAENGYFEVQNLPYGKYQLVEIEAPILDGERYHLSTEPIPFEITAESFYNKTVMVILNHREPNETTIPEKPNKPNKFLPETGEATNRILSVIAILILGFGLLLLRKKGK